MTSLRYPLFSPDEHQQQQNHHQHNPNSTHLPVTNYSALISPNLDSDPSSSDTASAILHRHHASIASPQPLGSIRRRGTESPTFDLNDVEESDDAEKQFESDVPIKPRSNSPVVVPTAADEFAPVRDSPSSDSSSSGPLFACRLLDGSVLITLLQTLLFAKEELILMTLYPQGIKFSCDKSKSLCARAYLKSNIFSKFQLRESVDQCGILLRLSSLINCLQIFGSRGQVEINYHSISDSLMIILEDEGVITQCNLVTLDQSSTEILEFDFRESPVAARAVVNSHFLAQAFHELEIAGSERICIEMNKTAPSLVMSTTGNSCEVRVELPEANATQDHTVVSAFDCEQEMCQYYSWSLMKPAIKAMARADHTNLRMNQEGMISMQHVIPVPNNKELTNWVEFLILAQEPAMQN